MGSLHSIFDLGGMNVSVTPPDNTAPAFGPRAMSRGDSAQYVVDGVTYEVAVANDGTVALTVQGGGSPLTGPSSWVLTTAPVIWGPIPGNVELQDITVAYNWSFAGSNYGNSQLSVPANGACNPNPYVIHSGSTYVKVSSDIYSGGSTPHTTTALPTIIRYRPVTDYVLAFWKDFVGCSEL